MRYLGDDDTGENITQDELQQLQRYGLKVGIVWQTGKSFVLSRSGTECASSALAQARELGMPEDRPIYFAVDFDTSNLTENQALIVIKFFIDAASVLGLGRVGIYGGLKTLDLIPQFATWGWQTYAWSGTPTVWHSRANVLQYHNGQSLCGGLVDYNRNVTEDFGQW